MQDYMDSLNAEQRKAVETTEGYIRVIAGAGSGKTRALTHRFIYLVDQMGVSPANILCVTFTNKAAREMKNRIHAYLGDEDLGMICTFHGFCVKVLKEDGRKMGYPRNFVILDNEDQETILKKVYDNCGYKSTDISFKDILNAIRLFKMSGKYLELFEAEKETLLLQKYLQEKEVKLKIIFGYLYEQRKNFAFDFDDLINATLYIFGKHANVLEKWQKRLEYIMVDEFQDVGARAYALCSLLSLYHKNLFVVGDPDQTIYSFRGASIYSILNFDKTFPTTQTIMMNTNYRSTKDIIDVSNSLISKNTIRIDKQLTAIRESNTLVVYYHAKTAKDEMEWIAHQTELLLQNGIPKSAIAVLYRAHYVTREIEEALLRHKLPYTIYSGIPFYGRKEIKDVLSYLRMLVTGDDFSFLRTINEPKRNFGKKRVEILLNYQNTNGGTLYEALQSNLNNNLIARTEAASYVSMIEELKVDLHNISISDLLKTIMRESGYEDMLRLSGDNDRLDNIAELEQSVVDYENSVGEDVSLEDYLSMVALYTNVDKEEKKNNISLMTVHAAKGLEFPYVFVCALSEGIFPSSKSLTKDALEEERRLAYVAFTRAKNALFLSDSEGFNFDRTSRFPSRFIFNIDKSLLNYTVELDEKLVESARSYIQKSEQKENPNSSREEVFFVGERVKHRAWGKGVIVSIDADGASIEIKYDKFETARHINIHAAKSVLTLEKDVEKKDIRGQLNMLTNSDNENYTSQDNAVPDDYKAAVDACAAKYASLRTPLKSMHYADITGNIIQVTFKKQELLNMKILERKVTELENIFSEVYGKPIRITMSLDSSVDKM